MQTDPVVGKYEQLVFLMPNKVMAFQPNFALPRTSSLSDLRFLDEILYEGASIDTLFLVFDFS